MHQVRRRIRVARAIGVIGREHELCGLFRDVLSPTPDAGAVLAFVVGALVLGAFAPRKTAGFASPASRVILAALLEQPG